MKKLFLLFVTGTMFIVAGWSQSGEPEAAAFGKIYDYDKSPVAGVMGNVFDGKTVYYLDGFDFGNYNKNDPSLYELTRAEVWAVVKGTEKSSRVTKAADTYSIIGHSQGGLRALGYISQLEADHPLNELDKIDAVITISGINRGLKMLEGGLGAFKERANKKVRIIGNGLIASAVAAIDIHILTFGLSTGIILKKYGAEIKNLTQELAFLLDKLPEIMNSFWVQAWISTKEEDFPQIRDMIPNSAYIKEKVLQKAYYYYRVKTGEKITYEWRYTMQGKLKLWNLITRKVPMFSIKTTTDSIRKFGGMVPVGFIAGTNNKTLTMADEKEKEIRKGIIVAEIIFRIAQGVHTAKNWLLIGLFTGSLVYAKDARIAKEFMENFDSVIQKDIILSTKGDGLVALESQYIPQISHFPINNGYLINLPRVLGGTPEGYVPVSRNHKNIVEMTKNDDTNAAIAFVKAGEMIDEAIAKFRGK